MPGDSGTSTRLGTGTEANLPDGGFILNGEKKFHSGDKNDGFEGHSELSLKSWRFVHFLYIFTVAGLLNLGNGYSIAFSSPLFDELIVKVNSTSWTEGFDNCLFQSLIGPSVLFGAILGGFCSSLSISVFGAVLTVSAVTVIWAVGWSLIGIAWFITPPVIFRGLFLSGRILTGIGSGWNTSSWTVYVSEVSPDKYRIGSIALGYIFYAVGIMETYILGVYFSFWICAFIYGGTMTALIPFVVTLPESRIRTRNILQNIKKLHQNFKNHKKIFPCGFALSPFLIRLFMMEVVLLCHCLMGYNVLLQYVGPLLEVAGASKWSVPHGVIVAITLGFSQMIGLIQATIVSRKLGHIISCSIGAMGVCLGHTGIAVYFILIDGLGPHSTGEVVSGNTSVSELCFFKPAINSDLGEKYSPLAFISMFVVVLFYGTFWTMQPYVIAAELFTDDTRGLGLGICSSSAYFYNVLLSSLFPYLESSAGTALTFVPFISISALAAILVPTLIPETDGRPMGERGDMFTPKQNCTELFQAIKTLLCLCKPKLNIEKL